MPTLSAERRGVWVEFDHLEGEQEKDVNVPEFLRVLLDKYTAVFNMPNGLPPLRGKDMLLC